MAPAEREGGRKVNEAYFSTLLSVVVGIKASWLRCDNLFSCALISLKYGKVRAGDDVFLVTGSVSAGLAPVAMKSSFCFLVSRVTIDSCVALRFSVYSCCDSQVQPYKHVKKCCTNEDEGVRFLSLTVK